MTRMVVGPVQQNLCTWISWVVDRERGMGKGVGMGYFTKTIFFVKIFCVYAANIQLASVLPQTLP